MRHVVSQNGRPRKQTQRTKIYLTLSPVHAPRPCAAMQEGRFMTGVSYKESTMHAALTEMDVVTIHAVTT